MSQGRSGPPSSRRLPPDSEPALSVPRRKSRLSLQISVQENPSSAPPPPPAAMSLGGAIAPMPTIAIGEPAPSTPSLVEISPLSARPSPSVPLSGPLSNPLVSEVSPSVLPVSRPPSEPPPQPSSRSMPPRPRAKDSLLPALGGPESEDIPLSMAMPESTHGILSVPSESVASVSQPPRSLPASELSSEDVLAIESVHAAPNRGAAPPPPPPVALKFSKTADTALEKTLTNHWWETMFDEDYLATLPAAGATEALSECAFIEEALGVVSGGRILDLGAGRGEHAVALAERGYSVTAIDCSEVMAQEIRDRARLRGVQVQVRVEDMRELADEAQFDGVYCVGGTFGYFTEDENIALLQKLHRALKPGGQLLIDVPNRDHLAPRLPSTAWFEGDNCVCMDEASMDFLTSRLHVKRTLMFNDGRVREHSYSIRLYAVHELGRALHKWGFRVVEISGDLPLPGIFFGAESPRIMMLVEKKA